MGASGGTVWRRPKAATVLLLCASGMARIAGLPLPRAGLSLPPKGVAAQRRRRGERRWFGLPQRSRIALGLAGLVTTLLLINPVLAGSTLAGIVLATLLARWLARITQPSSSGAMSSRAWSARADKLVTACSEVSVLRMDCDVEAARRAIRSLQDDCAIGSFGATGLAVVLTGQADSDAAAARARLALLQAGIHANLSVAAKPRDGRCLADLLAVTEAELVASRAAQGYRYPDAQRWLRSR